MKGSLGFCRWAGGGRQGIVSAVGDFAQTVFEVGAIEASWEERLGPTKYLGKPVAR